MTKTEQGLPKIVTREVTVNLRHKCARSSFKRRSKRAINEIRRHARKTMKTSVVKLHPDLSKLVWSRGIKNPPRKVRVRLSRQVNESDKAPRKYFTLVTPVIVDSFKGLQDEIVNEDEE